MEYHDDVDMPSLRIGDTERDAAVERLQKHYMAGRLNADEFNERMTAALAAHYQNELDKLFADLPDDPQTRFFDEKGPVGQASQPSEMTPWQAAEVVPSSSAGRRTAEIVLGSIGGVVWPLAFVAFIAGATWHVWLVAIVVSAVTGSITGALRSADHQRSLPPGAADKARQYRDDARYQAKPARYQARAAREEFRAQRHEYRRRRRGR